MSTYVRGGMSSNINNASICISALRLYHVTKSPRATVNGNYVQGTRGWQK